MIGLVGQGVRTFCADPVGALDTMRAAVPTAPVAGLALLALTLITMVIDYAYGAVAWPHTLVEGGKRAEGPIIAAVVQVVRIFGISAALWLGLRLISRVQVTGAEALWMTVPFSLAALGAKLAEAATWLLFAMTGLDIYGAIFFIVFSGSLLILIASARALAPGSDWLSALPIGFGAWVAGTYVPYLVLPIAGLFLLFSRRRT